MKLIKAFKQAKSHFQARMPETVLHKLSGAVLMKEKVVLLVVIMFLFTAANLTFADDDTKKHPACLYCSMDRQQFAHSRMLIEYEDGTVVPLCSLHCAAVDLALKADRLPKSIRVGDYSTRDLINAESAFWILGGAKMGVMTKRAKWAFARKESAERFMSGNMGELIGFDDALKASYEDMNADAAMIRNKRKMMRMIQKRSESIMQQTR